MSLATRARDLLAARLLPPRLADDPYLVRRARLLMLIHVMACASGAAVTALNLARGWGSAPALTAFTLLTAGLIYLYHRRGDVVLSGNLLVGLVTLVLLEGMLETGGLYSDNLQWLLLVPVIAYLFTTPGWGMLWSAVAIAVLVGLYVLETQADVGAGYRYMSLTFGPRYYLVSYLGLFAGVFGIVLLFTRGNDEILASLKATTAELRAEKERVEAQNERLREQEAALTRSNRDLATFAYVASHDLKEPLRMVSAYARQLDRCVGPTLGAREAEYMGFVRQGSERMQVMLDDLLAYSRLGREREEADDVDLERTLLLVRGTLRGRLEETGGEIVADALPTLRGKRIHFAQVLQNLLANSLKFHRPGVAPMVHVHVRERPGELVLEVADNGIGIRAHDLDGIFGVFRRLHPAHEYEGSGIGLATVKKIVEGLGGRVEVASVFGAGTTFRLVLPSALLVRPAAAATALT